MIAFICLFFPAVLGVWFFEHLRKAPLSGKHWLYRYCANVLIINCICFAVKRFFLNTGFDSFCSLYADTTPSAALNYLIMAIPSALIVPFVQVFFSKHATVTIEEREDA